MMNAGAPRWNWLGLFALLLGACGGPPGVLIDIGSWPRGAVSLRVQGTLDGTPAVEPIYYPAETTRFVVYVPRSGQLTLDLVAFDGNDCITAQAQTQQELGGLRALKEADVALAGSNPPLCPAPEILTVTPELAPTDPALPVTLTVRGQNFLPGATVTIDGVPAADVVLASRSEITATVPKHLGAFGLVPVSVHNFDGRQASRSDLFSYYASRIGFSAMRPYSVGMNAKMPRSVAVADVKNKHKLCLHKRTAPPINLLARRLPDGQPDTPRLAYAHSFFAHFC